MLLQRPSVTLVARQHFTCEGVDGRWASMFRNEVFRDGSQLRLKESSTFMASGKTRKAAPYFFLLQRQKKKDIPYLITRRLELAQVISYRARLNGGLCSGGEGPRVRLNARDSPQS